MKILIISSYIGRPGSLVGGGETYAELLAIQLADRGHHVVMGCWRNGTVRLNNSSGTLPARQVRIRSAMDLCAIAALIRVIRKDRIGLIIANSPKEYWPSIIAAKITGASVMVVRHLTRRISWATRTIINMADVNVIAVSNSVKQALLLSAIKEKLIKVVTNGVPIDEIAAFTTERDRTRKELGLQPDDLAIGFSGRLHPEKGLVFLVEAFGRISVQFPFAKLLIVGDGSDRMNIERHVAKLGITDRVLFTGRVVPVYKMYAAMDIFVMPSICEEAFGFAAAEAMAMGKPVIASDSGGLAEMITSGTDGILVTPGNTDALAAAIADLISDPELARSYAAAGQKKILKYFSVRIQGDLMNNLILAVEEDNKR
ncbi:MAG: glycosyltransferase [Thermodesulfovibrionales bacterium]